MKYQLSLLLCCLLALAFLCFPDVSIHWVSTITQMALERFDLLYVIIMSLILVLAVGLAFSSKGRIRLGGAEAKPEFNRAGWISMVIAAGMGSGLIFWSVAEPLYHFNQQPSFIALSQSPSTALALTYFHWGAHAWGLYALTGLVFAWYAFNCNRPMLISSAFSSRTTQQRFFVLDFVALVAVIFGVAGTLANTVALIQTGVSSLLPSIALGEMFRAGLLIVMAVIFIASSILGLKRGIQRLSIFNIAFALLLMLFVALWSGVIPLMTTLFESTWEYLRLLPRLSFGVESHSNWSRDWSVIYFLWWMCWAPFVGPFIARISYGRTIREFLLVVMLIPTGFTILWFSLFTCGIFNDSTILSVTQAVVQNNYTQGLFTYFTYYPFSFAFSIGAILLLMTFVITSADSALYVAALFMGRFGTCAFKVKLIWGIVLVSIAMGLVARNNVDLNKQVAIIGAIPFSIIMVVYFLTFLKDLLRYKPSSEEAKGLAKPEIIIKG
ncbi:MAG: BCCT family transporter [Cellvibrionales bacterium]|nr:BCCT family transporter [Cellvibrionales bacterium]